ncbi:MAG TPA: hypothetical protein VHS58_19240 [Acetobacteraceae bacterium]|nr:hypothetical protein [Acetobacteraceae bacterium]
MKWGSHSTFRNLIRDRIEKCPRTRAGATFYVYARETIGIGDDILTRDEAGRIAAGMAPVGTDAAAGGQMIMLQIKRSFVIAVLIALPTLLIRTSGFTV